MAVVELYINKKSYQLSCDDGDEPRLKKLAAQLDAKLSDIAAATAGAGDHMQLLMLALMQQDELSELRDKAPAHPSEANLSGLPKDHERTVIEALDTVSEFVEHLASRIQPR